MTDIAIAKISDPQRGDIVTFASPRDGVRLIKRIVALPGDIVEMQNEVLYINGRAAEYADQTPAREALEVGVDVKAIRATERLQGRSRTIQFLPEVLARRSFGPLVVPADSYFMLGDNRDNSQDSRYIGFVPRHLLIGRAHRIIVSANIKGNWLPRIDRTAEAIR
jgi:signal peptidase I